MVYGIRYKHLDFQKCIVYVMNNTWMYTKLIQNTPTKSDIQTDLDIVMILSIGSKELHKAFFNSHATMFSYITVN